MRATIYGRVSKDDKEQDPERQFIKCRDYCKLHEHDVMGEFKDYITGDSTPYARDAFSKMMELKPEVVIVFSIDRLSRQHPNKIMSLLTQFKDSGIIIVSITETLFNMESPFAEPLQYFLTWWNNYFLKKLKEDIKSGMDKAKLNGVHIGRPKCKFNEYRAYQLLIIEKKSLSEISKILQVSRSTLHRFKRVVIKNPNLFKKQHPIPKPDGFGTNREK